ncbi:MAG: hypothetical protein ABIF77_16660, partial [bacterium]
MAVLNVTVPSWSDLAHFLPEAILCGTFLLALLLDMVVRGRHPVWPFLAALAGSLTALAFAVVDLPATPHTVLGSLIVVDGLAAFFRILFIFVAVITILFSWSSEEIMGRKREHKGEFYALVA